MILSAMMCLAAFPMSAFAWTSEEGKACTSYFGEKYVGSDGEYYYSKPTTTSLFYNEDGSTYIHSYASGNAKTKYYMQDSSGTHQVYCIESGVVSEPGTIMYLQAVRTANIFRTCLLRHGWELW